MSAQSLEFMETEAARMTRDRSGLCSMGRQPESRATLEAALAFQLSQQETHLQIRDHATRALLATQRIIAAMQAALEESKGQVDA